MKVILKDGVISYLTLQLKSWSYSDNAISREFIFRNFVEAFSFMTAVALEAEKMDHHPDWKNAYNKVSINLSTHSAKGITQLDFDLAKKIDQIFKNT